MILFRFKFFYGFLCSTKYSRYLSVIYNYKIAILSAIHGGSKKSSNGKCCENVLKIMLRDKSTIALIYNVYS